MMFYKKGGPRLFFFFNITIERENNKLLYEENILDKGEITMKNLFAKNREGIVVAVIGVLMSILVIGSMILKFDDVMRVDYVVDDHIEDVELTDEMVEAYRALVLSGMGDWQGLPIFFREICIALYERLYSKIHFKEC